MVRRVIAGVAIGGLVVAVLVLVLRPDEQPEDLVAKGATVLLNPDGIFRPGRADPAHLTTQELETVEAGRDDRSVSLRFLGGNPRCWSLDRVRAVFEADRILVGLFGGYHKLPEGTACTADARFYSLTLALAEPLGGRPVEGAPAVVRGAILDKDAAGIFRPGLVRGDRIRATGIHTVTGVSGRMVTVRFSGGNSDCWSVDQALFRFEKESIVVGIYGGYHPPPGVFCTTEGRTYELTFRLDQAVKGRPFDPVDRMSTPS